MTIPANTKLVVIGASAGGVDAIGNLLAALPADFAPAVAVVLHLPPDRPSMLAELFASRCALPVKEAEDKEPIQPGTVVVAPPDYHLQVEPDHTFSLSCDEPVLYSRPSIDVLFDSAAMAYGAALLGIILTGASADGTAGLKAVRARGGQAWVQDPEDAVARLMPAAAIADAGADRVLPLEQMKQLLSGSGLQAMTQPI
ncbi:two-component system chemotaxis response regulator CheB [Paucimonas lemoignei]|uniref:protein-glutamate methylesterase n=1 Tax=Paucimonas lemoignei TaxID=29443 RepID=A0A4R3HU26_PAULE|nr:chemotaxis protein CheB [Paucimonas lemoignei]TCS35651.1 two-component system chemotaxis response regulator CheB [Paucimonas lemoignei]